MGFDHVTCQTCGEETLEMKVKHGPAECPSCLATRLRLHRRWEEESRRKDHSSGHTWRRMMEKESRASKAQLAATVKPDRIEQHAWLAALYETAKQKRLWEKRNRLTKRDLPLWGRRGTGEHGDLAFAVDMSLDMSDVPQGVLDSIQEARA